MENWCFGIAAVVVIILAGKRAWQQVNCQHDWHDEPNTWTDQVCRKCGKER